MEGNALAMQQQRLQMDQGKDQRDALAHSMTMIGSIALGAKGNRMDGQVDPQKFEQGLDYLQSRGLNVSAFRGRPEMADVAASASMTAMQQLQAGQMANAVQQQFLQNVLAVRRDARDEQNLQRQMGIAERTAAQQGIPSGFRRADNGNLEAIPGGPNDPASPANQSAATPQSTLGKLNADLARGAITREQFDVEQERITKAAETPLPQNVITSFNSAGKTLTDADRFVRTFDPKFAGYGLGIIGDAVMGAGRAGVGTEAGRQGAAWWNDYDRYKNQVRNELFGSALTNTEKGAFERADINPGMAPDQITTNLARQREAAQAAARKLIAPHVLAGKSVEQIESAVGFSLSDLGIARPAARARPQPPGTAPTAPPAAPATPAATRPAPGTVLRPADAGAREGRTGTDEATGAPVVVRNGQIVVRE
jgi:hypothetical protein